LSELAKSFGVAILGVASIDFIKKDDEKLTLHIKDLPEPISSDGVIDATDLSKNSTKIGKNTFPINLNRRINFYFKSLSNRTTSSVVFLSALSLSPFSMACLIQCVK